jgi:hypothetical protein
MNIIKDFKRIFTRRKIITKVGDSDLILGLYKEINLFQSKCGGKLLRNFNQPQGMRLIDFSKQLIENQVSIGKIYFILTGLKDVQEILVQEILSGKSKYNQEITAQELKYIFANWDRLKYYVIFINRFKIVEPPWIK